MGESNNKGTRKRHKSIRSFDSKELLQAAKLRVQNGKSINVPITPEGNRFANVVMVTRMREVIDNQLRIWQANRDKAIDAEEIMRLTRSMQYLAEMSYRAYGDTRDTPELPRLSHAQETILKEIFPGAAALLEASQSQDVSKEVVNLINVIDIEAEEKGLTDEDAEKEENAQDES